MRFVLVFGLFLMGTLAMVAAPPGAKRKPVAAPSSSAKKPVVRRATPMASRTSRKPIASSRAIYSRSNSSRRVRGGTNGRAAATVAATRTPSNWQARPSQERYIEIQQALADKGFFKGEANGTWGADSVTALKDFQRSQNLEPDGKLGSLSLIALGMGPKRIVASATAVDTQGSAMQQQQQQTSTVVEGAGRQQ